MGQKSIPVFDIELSLAYNGGNETTREAAVADKDERGVTGEQVLDLQQLKKRLDILDQRLDNIDSMVTAVAERVMSQPITFSMTCPRCGRSIEVAIIGTQKPTR
jgi:hypothetical protein